MKPVIEGLSRVEYAAVAAQGVLVGLMMSVLMGTDDRVSAEKRFKDFSTGVEAALTNEEFVEWEKMVNDILLDVMAHISG